MSRRLKIIQMLEENPADVFLNYSLAMEMAKEGLVSEATQQFIRVRTLDPAYIAAYFQEGQMLAREGALDRAREVLQQGIEKAREVGDSHALGEMTEFLDSL